MFLVYVAHSFVQPHNAYMELCMCREIKNCASFLCYTIALSSPSSMFLHTRVFMEARDLFIDIFE